MEMINKIFALMAAILLISLISTGCVDNNDDYGDYIVVTDILDREVTVPTDVNRIVGVASGAVRMISYLDATDLIVGVENFEHRGKISPYQFANPGLSELPDIGPQHGGDAEMILAQEPDVIFYSCSQVDPASEETMNNLQTKTGIPVIAIDLGDLDARKDVFYSSLRLMAVILAREEKAEDIINFVDGILEDLDQRTKSIPETDKPAVYIGGVALRGAQDILSTRASYPPFEYTNSKNVAEELGTGHAFIDKEKLLEWDPEVLFIDSGSYENVIDGIRGDASYQILQAIENGELYTLLPYNRYNINHATVLANAYYVGLMLYPEQFSDIDIAVQADVIYEEMLGMPVYSDMAHIAYGFGRVEL